MVSALEELADEVRIDAAMVRARETLVRRLEDFVAHVGDLGFTRLTLTRDPTGMLVFTVDPEAIAIRTGDGPVFRSVRGGETCPVCFPRLETGAGS